MNERDEMDRAVARDQRMAVETIRGQLVARDVRVRGDESPEQLAELLTAVERFERVVAARGGDSMTNAPDSRNPDDPDLVLPRRWDDEGVAHYTGRISATASRLEQGA